MEESYYSLRDHILREEKERYLTKAMQIFIRTAQEIAKMTGF